MEWFHSNIIGNLMLLSLLYVLLSGIALPVGGIQMQYLWRNQLGDVYSLGFRHLSVFRQWEPALHFLYLQESFCCLQ